MKIIYFLQGTFNSGGKERIVTRKANWLASQGHDVTIITSDQKGRPDYFPLEGVRRIDFDLMFSETSKKNFIKKYFQRRKLLKRDERLIRQYVNEIKPDIIISTFEYEKNILPRLKDGSAKLVEIHFSRWFRLQRNRKGIGRWIDKFLTKQDFRNVRKYKVFVCLTDEDKENWKGLKNVRVIKNFIEGKTEEPAALDNKKFIAVGRLSYQKGFDRLIEAWKGVNNKYPEWRLVIYGDGPLKESLLKKIADYELTEVVKIYPPVKDIHQKYLECSGLIMTSHYEGLPMVMLEAMEAGLPVVTFDYQCGPKDIIKDGENGFIIKDNDTVALAHAIGKLIQSPELRKRMGKKSFEMAKDFLPEKILPKWEALFNQTTLK